jgi:hypothetical protein
MSNTIRLLVTQIKFRIKMKKNNSDWRVHIGAHKTATTHLQNTIEQLTEELETLGKLYIPRDKLRSLGGISIISNTKIIFKKLNIISEYLPFDHWLKDYTYKTNNLLISEENILGGVSDALSKKIYPNAEKNIKNLFLAAGDSKVSIFLSIRSLDTFLPSVYAQRCRFGRTYPGEFDSIHKAALNNPLRWSNLIHRIIKASPLAKIYIWRYEDYIIKPEIYLSAYCGTENLHFPKIEIPNSTKSPSLEAIIATEQLNPRLNRKIREVCALNICKNDNGNHKFKPFNDKEALFLANAFKDDIQQIKKNHPQVIFI